MRVMRVGAQCEGSWVKLEVKAEVFLFSTWSAGELLH